MTTAVYPGNFDSVTDGHPNIIKRTSEIFDHLIIAALNNRAKSPLFTTAEHVIMLYEMIAGVKNIEVESFDGLSIKYCHEKSAQMMVCGLRTVADFEYELQIAQTDRVIAPDTDTTFLITNLKYSYLSPSIVREIAAYQDDVSALINSRVAAKIIGKYSHSQNCGGGAKV